MTKRERQYYERINYAFYAKGKEEQAGNPDDSGYSGDSVQQFYGTGDPF